MENLKTTNVFVVLNEETMQIATQTIGLNEGFAMHEMPKIFETEKEADDWAAMNLEIWDVKKSHFNHKWIEHKQNTKPEVVKVEMGKSIDTDSNELHVKIRFAKWVLCFDWTINNKLNMVRANETPTKLDGGEIEENDSDAKAIIEFFDFDSLVFAKQIELRKHHIQ